MNEYPTMSLEEQMMVKGGSVPIPIGPIVTWLLRAVGVAGSAASIWALFSEEEKKNGVQPERLSDVLKSIPNSGNVTSIKLDSLTNNGAYNVQIFYGEDKSKQ